MSLRSLTIICSSDLWVWYLGFFEFLSSWWFSTFLLLDKWQMYQPNGVTSSNFSRSNTFGHGQHLESGANTMDTMSGGNNLNNASLASKQRLRWTHELHERFVDAVGQLGGPDRESYFHYLLSWKFKLCHLLLIYRARLVNQHLL